MKQLILLRHGRAEPERSGSRDFDRSLSRTGAADVLSAARTMSEAGVKPGLALVSPARRTSETWAAIASGFTNCVVSEDARLYMASGPMIQQIAGSLGDQTAVIVVGHNPGLQQAALALARSAGDTEAAHSLSRGLPTGGGAVIYFDEGQTLASRVRLFGIS